MEVNTITDYDNVVKWSYTLARKWAIEFLLEKGINSSRKFDKYKREKKYLPKSFPREPNNYFNRRDTWKGWDDFFGNPSRKKNYLTYNQAKSVVRKNNIMTSRQFRTWKKRPLNIPSTPESQYEEWTSWGDFTGVDNGGKLKNAKLKEQDVRIIKHQMSLGVAGAVLAKMFKVSEMQISRIKSGENWGNI